MYYLQKPKIVIREWYPNYTIDGYTFPALVKTDKYFLIDNTTTNYEKLKSKNTKHQFPELLLIKGGN